jgi:predicted nucleic acid-binding protein
LLVLDANILIRAVLGTRVRSLLIQYGNSARFVAPETAFAETREHLPVILAKRGISTAEGFAVLDAVSEIVQAVGSDSTKAFEKEARLRLASRDEDDWPVLATALTLNCPIWTEDMDFFGSGVPTWTTDRVELLLRRQTE